MRVKGDSSDNLTLTPASTMEAIEDLGLQIHPISTQDGVIIRVQPPAKPRDPSLHHVPCDIVLVIDVSGSMSSPAPAKMSGDDGKPSQENFGLSILDMVKHAARTILSTLNQGDRLGIVTYSTEAVVCPQSSPIAWHLLLTMILPIGHPEAVTDDRR